MAFIRAHNIILAGIILLGLVFIYPFAIALLLAAITSYALYPLVTSLRKIIHSYNLALAISLLTIIIPSFYLLRFAAGDISPLIHDMRLLLGDVNVLIDFVESQISVFGLEKYTVELQNILNHITDSAISSAATFFQSIPRLLLNLAIYIFATYHFIRDGGRIVTYATKFIESLEIEERLLFTSIIDGLKKSFDVLFLSYITMAIITGTLAWIGYYALGIPYAALLALLSGLFSFLPVFGVWMVYVPVGLYEYSIGNMNTAVFVVMYGLLVLNLATDMIIRPSIGSKKANVNPLTIFLGFFAGPIVMGAPGIIIGPIVFVLVETVLKEYADYIIVRRKKKKPKLNKS